jgi:hypothetical protein
VTDRYVLCVACSEMRWLDRRAVLSAISPQGGSVSSWYDGDMFYLVYPNIRHD